LAVTNFEALPGRGAKALVEGTSVAVGGRRLVTALSRATYRKMVQNLVWATAYNIVAIPVAAGLFVHWGFDLPMSVGAVAMSLSTLIVAANAQLLRGLTLQHDSLRP
jgi:Cu2+-exporting ATPase